VSNARRGKGVRVVGQTIPSLDGAGPLWLQIRRAIAGPIVDGRWPSGTRLPSEIELTTRFGVSRMTVGKAVQSLAAEGLLHRRRRLGTVVAERAQERPVFEIWDIADLVVRSGARYDYRLLECRRLAGDCERRELLGVSARTPVLWIRCLHLSDQQPFQLEERLINIAAAPGIMRHPFKTQAPGPWLIRQVPWTCAEHRISANEAPAGIALELNLAPRSACLVVDRRTWHEVMPVTHARLWHPGSRHSLTGRFGPGR
jgi:GntR family histidine utilization transcriptional repressor